jgi:putative Holliday junction resolvase
MADKLLHKILGFDFGMKYIGIAFGQSVTNTAIPVTTIRAQDGIPDWQEIAGLLSKWAPTALVVGLPKNLDGSEQEITFCAQKFANRLKEKFKLPVYMVDEALSTWEAKTALGMPYKASTHTKEELRQVNAMAAAILVERWLNKN